MVARRPVIGVWTWDRGAARIVTAIVMNGPAGGMTGTPVRPPCSACNFRSPCPSHPKAPPVELAEYNQAVDRFADGIYRFAVKHLRDTEQAKDVVQESFARLWQRVEEVDGAKAKSYLFTTAHHLLVDSVRMAARSTPLERRHEHLAGGGAPQPDLKEILEEALAGLPPVQRSVVLLRDLEGYTYEEIAAATGLNVTQVKVYIYRGRTALKNYIGSLENVL